MNPIIEAIKSRRSVRVYDSKPVPKEILDKIIEAGNSAPYTSMTRSQPWRFVVVQDPEFKKKLLETAFPFWKNSISGLKEQVPDLYEIAMRLYNVLDDPKDVIYYSAPAIVFVIGPNNGAVSCALACENMMIAAQSFGLGSCYVGFGAMIKGNEKIVEALELQKDEAIFGPVLLGYPITNPTKELDDALKTLKPFKKEPTTKWI